MPTLTSRLDVRSAEFKAAAEQMRLQVADLGAQLADLFVDGGLGIAEGGAGGGGEIGARVHLHGPFAMCVTVPDNAARGCSVARPDGWFYLRGNREGSCSHGA